MIYKNTFRIEPMTSALAGGLAHQSPAAPTRFQTLRSPPLHPRRVRRAQPLDEERPSVWRERPPGRALPGASQPQRKALPSHTLMKCVSNRVKRANVFCLALAKLTS